MDELKTLLIEGNMLKRIRMGIIRKGAVGIKKYLRDIAPENH